MDDIAARLKHMHNMYPGYPLYWEAAEEIEQLRARNKMLRKAYEDARDLARLAISAHPSQDGNQT